MPASGTEKMSGVVSVQRQFDGSRGWNSESFGLIIVCLQFSRRDGAGRRWPRGHRRSLRVRALELAGWVGLGPELGRGNLLDHLEALAIALLDHLAHIGGPEELVVLAHRHGAGERVELQPLHGGLDLLRVDAARLL